jgi:hypothetical protein
VTYHHIQFNTGYTKITNRNAEGMQTCLHPSDGRASTYSWWLPFRPVPVPYLPYPFSESMGLPSFYRQYHIHQSHKKGVYRNYWVHRIRWITSSKKDAYETAMLCALPALCKSPTIPDSVYGRIVPSPGSSIVRNNPWTLSECTSPKGGHGNRPFLFCGPNSTIDWSQPPRPE